MTDTKYRIVEKTVEAEQTQKPEPKPSASEGTILLAIIAAIVIFLIAALWIFGI